MTPFPELVGECRYCDAEPFVATQPEQSTIFVDVVLAHAASHGAPLTWHQRVTLEGLAAEWALKHTEARP